MDTVLWWFILLILLVLAWEDFRTRTISIWALLALSGLGVTYSAIENGLQISGVLFAINSLFICLQLALLTLYFYYKNGKITTIADRYLGWGDILIFFALGLFFSPLWFVLFYTTSLLLVLLSHLSIRFFRKKIPEQIPLAGGQAICLGLALILAYFLGIDLYNG